MNTPKSTPKPNKKSNQKPKLQTPKKPEIPLGSTESFNLQSNSFSMVISKKIEQDEFELIKSQIENFIKFVEKKISTSNP